MLENRRDLRIRERKDITWNIPGEDMAGYDAMTESAVNFCNSARFLPRQGRWARLAVNKGYTI